MPYSDAYNPDELQDYLQSAQAHGYTPSFSNRQGVIESAPESSPVFAVGIRQLDDGRWEKIKTEQKKALPPQDQAAEEMLSKLRFQAPSMTPLMKHIYDMETQKLQIEQEQEQLLAPTREKYADTIERQNATITIFSRGEETLGTLSPKGAAYAEQRQNAVTTLTDTLQMQKVEETQIKLSPEYLAFENQKSGLTNRIELARPAATSELQLQTSLKAFTDKATAQTQIGLAAARDAISPERANAAALVIGGNIGPEEAKIVLTEREGTLTAMQKKVISDVESNTYEPERNTPLANIHKIDPEFQIYKDMYLESLPELAKASGRTLLAGMTAFKKEKSAGFTDYLKNPAYSQYQDITKHITQIGTSATARKTPEYQAAVTAQAMMKQKIAEEYYQEQAVGQLKQGLFDSSTEFLTIPTNMPQAEREVASRMLESIKNSKSSTLRGAVNLMYGTLVPQLVAEGHTPLSLIYTVQNLLESYATTLSEMHSASGISITPTDLTTFLYNPNSLFFSTFYAPQ